eukprot:1227-Eustigmatos_ZCMA.PRE.1
MRRGKNPAAWLHAYNLCKQLYSLNEATFWCLGPGLGLGGLAGDGEGVVTTCHVHDPTRREHSR